MVSVGRFPPGVGFQSLQDFLVFASGVLFDLFSRGHATLHLAVSVGR